MLLVTDSQDDPALGALTDAAWHLWLRAVGEGAFKQSDIVQVASLDARDEDLDELERAELATRLPFGYLRLLRRGELWDI